MRNVKLDNSDLLSYFDTIEKLKGQPTHLQNHQGILISFMNVGFMGKQL